MSKTRESFNTIVAIDLERAIGGINWVKAAKAARDAALELWSGSQLERIKPPSPTRPPVQIIDPRPAPRPPKLPDNVRIPGIE